MTTSPGAPEPSPRGSSPDRLSLQHIEQFEAAKRRGKKIRWASFVASFNAWCESLIGGTCLLVGIFDRTSLVMGVVISAAALIEFKGAAMFRRMDLRAPRLGATAQLLFLATIGTYCIWKILSPTAATAVETTGNEEVDSMMAGIARGQNTVFQFFYCVVLIGSILMQGLTAVYYFTRARHMRAFLRETPEWVVQLQRRAS